MLKMRQIQWLLLQCDAVYMQLLQDKTKERLVNGVAIVCWRASSRWEIKRMAPEYCRAGCSRDNVQCGQEVDCLPVERRMEVE